MAKSKTENVILTNMCMIYNDNGEVLVQDRVKDWAGVTFPGGKVEPGESFVESTIREIKEETGLDISNLEICGTKTWYEEDINQRYVVMLYKTKTYKGTLESCDEGKVFWINLKDIHSYKLSHGFDQMLKIFINDDLNEFYYYKENDDWKFKIF